MGMIKNVINVILINKCTFGKIRMYKGGINILNAEMSSNLQRTNFLTIIVIIRRRMT